MTDPPQTHDATTTHWLTWLVHPVLLAWWQVGFLYHRNIDEYQSAVLARPMLVLMFAAIALTLTLRLVCRTGPKAGLLASACVVGGFAFGNLANLLQGLVIPVGPMSLGCRKLALIILAVPLAGVLMAIRHVTPPIANRVSKSVLIISVVMLAIMAGQIVFAHLGTNEATTPLSAESMDIEAISTPDIYYIVLDGYGRDDVLRDDFGYDNSAFIEALEARGFTVARQARANYVQTALSLACTMNMTYLDGLADRLGKDATTRKPLRRMIDDSALWRMLSHLGYKRLAFATGYDITEMRGADYYLSPPQRLTRFEQGLLDMTPVGAMLNVLAPGRQYDEHRSRILFALDNLHQAAHMTGPIFTFAHIICPHPPFVLGPQGEFITPNKPFSDTDLIGPGGYSQEKYTKKFPDQIEYLNSRILDQIDLILTKSAQNDKPRPVILIQGDHGPSSGSLDTAYPDKHSLHRRSAILSACNFNRLDLSQDISSVNAFAVILSGMTTRHFDLKDNMSFWSTWSRPYDFHRMDLDDTPQAPRADP